MKKLLFLAGICLVGLGAGSVVAQTPAATPDENPEGNTGALKAQVTTGASYDAHSGNATRIVNDLHVPGALGVYGLDFTRYWNSIPNDHDNPYAQLPTDFGFSGWSHSWGWYAYEEDTSEKIDPMDDNSEEIFTTAITITFPDGHANRYKITRSNQGHVGQFTPWQYGPPYTAAEQNGFLIGGSVHDLLRDMAPDGSQFWLDLADGGAVHFINGPSVYYATEVFDPHGLRTQLDYDGNGHLRTVTQDGGRSLNIEWSSYGNLGWAIHSVSNGGSGGSQTVIYQYPDIPGAVWLTLSTVDYPEGAQAVYTYANCYGDYPCSTNDSAVPLLKVAQDPHYAGAMTKIRYTYRGSACQIQDHPPEAYEGAKFDYYLAPESAISAEKSGDTGITVSSFVIGCFTGTRSETSGFGAWRFFNFGRSTQSTEVNSAGYQLVRLTDFTNSPNPPFERQRGGNEPSDVWDGRNIHSRFVYADGSGQPTEIHHTGADGSASYYDRTNAGNSEARDPLLIHNPFNHWLFSHTDERNQTTIYTRDSRRRVARIDYPDGSAEIFAYNNFNQVTSHTLPSGAVVTYFYDARGLLQRESNSIDGWDARKEYTYDSLDRVWRVSDGRSRSAWKDFSTRMTYNGRHQILTVEYAGMNNAPDNPIVRYGYDGNGNCTSITDELGHPSSYEYDDYRRCLSYTEPLNAPDWNGGANVPSRRWDWIYDRYIDGIGLRDASSHTKNEWRVQIEPIYNGACERRVTARWHDLQNRVVLEQAGWVQPCNAPTGYWFAGPDIETHYFTYDQNGQKSSYTDPLNRITTYDYDLRNRPWKTNETVNTVPRTTETLYDYVGNKTRMNFPVEAAGQRSQQWLDYDAFGQPGRFIDERGNTTNLGYCWGPMKKLCTVTTHRSKDAGGIEDQPTVFWSDPMGRPTRVIFPDGSDEASSYEFGQLKTWKTRKGQVKTITYDPRGREVSHTWSDDTPGISRTWDNANRLSAISNSVASLDYQYDDAGQPKYEGTTIVGSGNYTHVNYLRYPDGNVSHMQYPNGIWVRHDYNARGQLERIYQNWGNSWNVPVEYHYLADGKLNYKNHGSGIQTLFGYDGRGFTSQVHNFSPSSGQEFTRRNYYRDERDRITSFQKGSGNPVNPMEDGRGDHYWYDAEGQLTDAYYGAIDPVNNPNNPVRVDYFPYDELGNRLGWNLVTSKGWLNFARKDNGLNQYRAWWNYSIINHDDDLGLPWGTPGAANGVLMQDGWITAGYNALNQPKLIWSASNSGGAFLWLGYDPLGRCVKRWYAQGDGSAPSAPMYFVYDGWNLVQEGYSPWSPTRFYINGARVDEIAQSYNSATGVLAYHYYDASGHCTLLTDLNGNIMEQYYYDAFGYPYFYNGSGNWLGYSPHGNRFLFTGREWLSELRLYDYRNRMYQPELGRFLQPDPKEFGAGDYNLYRYCHNDPVNRSDPFGLIDRDIDKDLDKKGIEASQNSLKAAKDAGDHTGRSQAVQEKDGKRSLGSKIAKGSTTTEKRMIGGRLQTITTQEERAPVDPGHKPVGVGHAHMDKTGKADPNFTRADYGSARGSKTEPGIPVYKVNESNPSQILRLTPQVDYRDEPTIRPVSP
ncbi:MAG: hypothetical protein DME97_06470 [Verrucomicrobia bacterium]|nr:MAG: hypothetical protein DME97_06470 [Verrucomicrobiota bacterium]